VSNGGKRDRIPEQTPVSWTTALAVSWAGLKRRLLRSLITMIGVVLAIALLAYMLTMESFTTALVDASGEDGVLFHILQEHGVDVVSGGGADTMMVMLLGLSLLTCTVGIINAMLMSVTERVREIGTLKCLGARDQFIVKTYFIESAIQGIFGAAMGMFLGFAVAIAVAANAYRLYAFKYFPFMLVGRALVISLAAGSAISIIAAIAPAYAAARKQPVDALRVEE